jgi:hypothetical protein
VISALKDAEDYKAFEAAIIADYDAQTAVERELVLRLASLLWRLRRATTMETGLFETQADHLNGFRQARQVHQPPLDCFYKCDAFYSPADEIVVRWNDPAIDIEWGVAAPKLSARDAAAPLLADVEGLPKYGHV